MGSERRTFLKVFDAGWWAVGSSLQEYQDTAEHCTCNFDVGHPLFFLVSWGRGGTISPTRR
eukprot:449341-Prorocentrum_lima.AAC.1